MYNHPHQDRVDTNMEVEQQEREKQPTYVCTCMYITTVKGMKTSNYSSFHFDFITYGQVRGLSDTMDTWTMGPPVMAANYICNQLNMSIYIYGGKSTQAVLNDEFHHHEDKQSI